MAEVVRIRSERPSRNTARVVAGTAGAAEVVAKAAVGIVSVRMVSGVVRDHPVLTLLLATGLGYLFGNGFRRVQSARTAKPVPRRA
jgi:hypothetical protein